jgi:protocatechuate 3,4-dioxygenase beta subunit
MRQAQTDAAEDALAAASGNDCSANVIRAAGRLSRATPALILGPFYPLQRAADADARLWRGEHLPDGVCALQFQVRVATREGWPVVGACVELWHADCAGHYPHPSCRAADAVLRGFTGYGMARTDAHGSCEFDTLVPGAYRAEGGLRARHLHVQISGRYDRLVTQVFLPDDPLRHEDRWYRAAARPDLLLADTVRGTDSVLRLLWTAVLTRG